MIWYFIHYILGICHSLQGTDATYFHQFLEKEKPVWFYVEELCRSVYAEFDIETKVKGIPTWRYRAAKDLFNYDVSKNLCFCPGFEKCLERYKDNIKDEWDKSNCSYDEICLNGLLHPKGCYGVPVVLSQPHFFLCDAQIVDAIDGMHPDIDKHDSYLDGKYFYIVLKEKYVLKVLYFHQIDHIFIYYNPFLFFS